MIVRHPRIRRVGEFPERCSLPGVARRSLPLAWLVLLLACGDPPATASDGGPRDDAGLDAALVDAALVDAGGRDDASLDAAAPDASGSDDAGQDGGALDAGPMIEGTIAGPCGEIDTELLDPSPFHFENELTFPVRLTEADLVHFTEGARDVIAEGTVGGSSVYSEAMSFEVLARCEGASLLASEPGIHYVDPGGSRTDLLVVIDGHRVGVSVTRAVAFPFDEPYPLSSAQSLLTQKLEGIQESSANVAPEHAWVKQILHVIAYAPMHGEMFRMAWETTPADLRADTILLVTVTHGEDAFIYENML